MMQPSAYYTPLLRLGVDELPEATIYTDGACLNNPGGPGGIGAIIQHSGETLEISKGYPAASEGEPQVTNNRMEMLACVEALRTLEEPSSVTLYSDSELVVYCAMGEWKRKANLDLWAVLNPLLERHSVTFKWVKGHAGNKLNNRCDELAGEAASQQRFAMVQSRLLLFLAGRNEGSFGARQESRGTRQKTTESVYRASRPGQPVGAYRQYRVARFVSFHTHYEKSSMEPRRVDPSIGPLIREPNARESKTHPEVVDWLSTCRSRSLTDRANKA